MKKIKQIWSKYKRYCIFKVFITLIIISLIYLIFQSLFKEEDCNVAGINLHGTIITYIPEHSENDSSYDFDYDSTSSDGITWLIEQANSQSNIKAIVVEVDSSGGSPVAGEEISRAIEGSTKPVVAFIRDIGASGAYWSISGSNKIFASQNSDVGSIGVTGSFLNNVDNNKKEGYEYEELTAGKYKDSGSPDRRLTNEERALFLRDVNIIHENFIEAVSKNRNLPLDQVRIIADGSTVLGARAKELGLIDEIGGIYDVEKYLENILEEEINICWE